MKGMTMLKVTSVLMIIGGILATVLSIIAVIGVGTLAAFGVSSGLLYVACIIALGGSAIQIITGIKGLGACNIPSKAASCVIWGIIVIAICVISEILTVIAGDKFSIFTLLLGLVLPVLYIVGAIQLKEAAAGR